MGLLKLVSRTAAVLFILFGIVEIVGYLTVGMWSFVFSAVEQSVAGTDVFLNNSLMCFVAAMAMIILVVVLFFTLVFLGRKPRRLLAFLALSAVAMLIFKFAVFRMEGLLVVSSVCQLVFALIESWLTL